MTTPFVKHIQALPDTVPFVGPETLERQQGKPFIARIGANESAFGMSPLASLAIQNATQASGCSWYGDPENFELRTLLAEKHQIPMDNLCVDAGIDSLIGLSIRLFIEPGASVVSSLGAYPTVNYHVNGFGGLIHSVPYKDNHEDPVTLVQSAHANNARLIYLANPDNPMGTCVHPDAIRQLLDSLPENCILMLDEAYVEFMEHKPVLPIDVGDPRLIRFRTFSKAYGMAGLRIGYVMGHRDTIAGFNRIRNHFGVNRMAQLAAAASLKDDKFLDTVKQRVEGGRLRIYALADSLSLDYLPSSTNFVAVDSGSTDNANSLIASLAQQGIFMRKPAVAPQSRYVRVGVGTDEEHQYLTDVFPELVRAIQTA